MELKITPPPLLLAPRDALVVTPTQPAGNVISVEVYRDFNWAQVLTFEILERQAVGYTVLTMTSQCVVGRQKAASRQSDSVGFRLKGIFRNNSLLDAGTA